MSRWRYPSLLFVALLIASACQQAPGGAAPTGVAGTATPGGGAPSPVASPTGDPNDVLAKVRQRGEIRVSTDPNYKPQSFLRPDGTFEGFDIDVANEIGRRLGVKVKFETPTWEAITAGSWAGRWDVSVGSMTITEDRRKVLDFTQPYYYTPAQLTARKDTGITTVAGFAGKKICVGAATTYLDWVNGTLKLGDGSTPRVPAPSGVKAVTLETDQLCAQAIKAGRKEFEGFMSSSTTVEAAIKDGTPIVKVEDPIFYEPLAIAIDKKGPAHAELLREVDRIVGEMHADGTLSNFSKKWFDGLDLTKKTT